MFVISSSTAFKFRGKPIDTKQIGRDLGVRYVLEGSVQRSADRVRVNVQLIEAGTGADLWVDRFDRNWTELFALRDEITGRIAWHLNTEVATAEAGSPAEPPDALDYILRGRAEWHRWPIRDNYAQAIHLFQQALALDPQSVEAQTMLADVLATRVLRWQTDTPAADLARAEVLVEQALDSSPRNGLAHASISRLRAGLLKEYPREKIRALFEATYIAGLRQAGMPEE
jgi:adenylate cyclase